MLKFLCALFYFCLTASSQTSGSPRIQIVTPNVTGTIKTALTVIEFTGTATGGAPIRKVTWSNRRGGAGKAAGTATWTTGPVALFPGLNQIAIQAVDSTNRAASAFLNVDCSPSGSGQVAGRAVSIGGSPAHGSRGATVLSSNSLWPKANGIYQVAFDPPQYANNMAAAIATFNATFAGVIQWVPRTSEADYVAISLNPADLSGVCQSPIGKLGGAQTFGGSGSCTVQSLLRQIGHTVGLWDEQSRHDRDSYVTVAYSNIIRALQSNLDQAPNNEIDLGLYDYGSVMHATPFELSKNGEPVIESIPAGIPLSNPAGFSAGDVDSILRLYGAAPTQVTITSNPPGLPVSVDGTTIVTPQVFSFALNSSHTVSAPAGNQSLGSDAYTFGNWSDKGGQTHTIDIAPGNGLRTSPPTSPQVTVYTANYVQLIAFTQSVSPNGAGTVNVTPPPLNGFYVARQQVTLQASPKAGVTFYQWSGVPSRGASANPLSTRLLVSPIDAQAQFSNQPVTTVSTNPPGLAILVDGSAYYSPQNFAPDYLGAAWAAGQSHSLDVDSPQSTYSPNTQYSFASWSDGGAKSHSISTAASNTNVSASMSPAYAVSYSANQLCGGNIGVTPLVASGGFADAGSLLSIAATPNPGWLFTGFSGDLTGTVNPQSITIADESLVSVDFDTTTVPLTIRKLGPAVAVAGGPAFLLNIYGTGFTSTTTVSIGNVPRAGVVYSSPTKVSVPITADDIASAGGFQVTVRNAPAGASCAAAVSSVFAIASTPLQPPTADSVSPKSGTGLTQTFTFTFSDPYFASDIEGVYVLFNTSATATNACYLVYNQTANLLYLANDQGTDATTINLGSGSIGNSQCTVDGAASSAIFSGNNLILKLAIAFSPGFSGAKNIYMLAGSEEGISQPMLQLKGTWTPSNASAVLGVDETPKNGTGASQVFNLTLSDSAGRSDIAFGFLLINNALYSPNSCTVLYIASSNALYLLNDPGTAYIGPLTAGGSGTVSNSQCAINPAGAISTTGTTIAVPVNITFLPAFAQPNTMFGLILNAQGASAGWNTLGTWARGMDQSAPLQVGGDPSVNPLRFRVTRFATGLSFPASMQQLDDGSILVATSKIGPGGTSYFSSVGEVLRLVDADRNGIADDAGTVLYTGLPGTLTSLRRAGPLLFVTSAAAGNEQIAVLRAGPTPASTLSYVGSIRFAFPPGWQHTTYALAIRNTPFTTDSYEVFFNIGSAGNVTTGTGTVAVDGLVSGSLNGASIYSFRVSGASGTPVFSGLRQIAAGLRNAAGMAFQPGSGDLYLEDNGADSAANPEEPLAADEMNKIGSYNFGLYIPDFGFPTDYVAYRTGTVVGGTKTQPIGVFQPLTDPVTRVGSESEGPVEIAFAPPGFPSGLNTGLFIGFYGRYLAGVPNEENPVAYYEPTTGKYFHFLDNDQALGHPDGLLSTQDSLFVSDLSPVGYLAASAANTGTIYQIQALSTPRQGNPPPASVSVAPASGNGTGANFSFLFSDPAGFTKIAGAKVMFSTTGNAAGACFLYYDRLANLIYLSDDLGWNWIETLTPGSNGAPISPGGPGILRNGQCAVDASTSSVSAAGTTLTLNLALTFDPSFEGAQNIYAWDIDTEGQTSGWQTLGKWTPR